MKSLPAGSCVSSAAPAPGAPSRLRVAGFRTKLLVAMMLVVGGVTVLAVYFAQRGLAASVERDLEQQFRAQLDALHHAQEIRRAALAERCRALVSKARIRGALEEAPDLLYPNAYDEMADIMRHTAASGDPHGRVLHATFYRFLDRNGAVMRPDNPARAGALAPAEEAQLALRALPTEEQIGYVARSDGSSVAEIMAMPIASTETGEIMAALVLGFRPFELGDAAAGMKSGIWLRERVWADTPGTALQELQRVDVQRALAGPVRVALGGVPHLLLAKHLNPGSQFPAAVEVCAYPLADLALRQRQLAWQVGGAGVLLLLLGLMASHVAAARLSAPVEKLAVDSERSARFSADASHQLKTPVTVLRAGLEELLARDNLTADESDQISALIHQTYRLSSLIEDLLLLSRMDSGHLKLELGPVDLSQLIEASLDDLGALPDELNLDVKTEFPPHLTIAGEKRYTAIILQNLLENARKYNRRGGRIRIVARADGGEASLRIANTGRPIAPAAQSHIFERFHRGAMGENVPGYGLGLNLARELARLHGGELRLVRSDENETEFEVRLRLALPEHPGRLYPA